MRAVIFGSNGQDGHYLTRLLGEKGYQVTGIDRGLGPVALADFPALCAYLKQQQPELVFHLAALSSTKHEFLFDNHHIIATGTLHILEAVKKFSPASKVFISGSGLQFQNENKPIKETDPFEARDAYAVARIVSVYAARYFRSMGTRAYVGYFFNHDSPLRTESHMTKKISEAAKRAGKGDPGKLTIGDLDAVKEYGFAGDIVNGIWTLVNQEEWMEANIATGKGYAIKDWLEACFSRVHKNWQDYVLPDPGFVPDYRQLVADPSRIHSLGWKAETGFSQLADMMMQ